MQIFQTTSSTRWNRFKWISLFFILAVIVSITILIVALQQVYTPALPRFNNHIMPAANWQPDTHTNPGCKKLAPGFQQYIINKEKKGTMAARPPAAEGRGVGTLPLPSASAVGGLPQAKQGEAARGCGIRSAFYVDWDPQSFFSLQRNISNLNLVIPEWIFIDPKADTVYTQIDDRALAVMKKSGIPVMPMLSYNY